jgi:hypothetical protein
MAAECTGLQDYVAMLRLELCVSCIRVERVERVECEERVGCDELCAPCILEAKEGGIQAVALPDLN